MRKMMMIVTTVFSLAACGVESPEGDRSVEVPQDFDLSSDEPFHAPGREHMVPGVDDFQPLPERCRRSEDCSRGECDLVTRLCFEPEIEQPTVTKPHPWQPVSCDWDSQCVTNACDRETRTCYE